MGHWQRRIVLLVLAAAMLPASLWAAGVVLPYRDSNKWVAPTDNAGLKALMAQAHNGVVFYRVALPKENRALAVERLTIVRDLLAREAKQPVVMEEASTAARTQTLAISY